MLDESRRKFMGWYGLIKEVNFIKIISKNDYKIMILRCIQYIICCCWKIYKIFKDKNLQIHMTLISKNVYIDIR